MRFPDEQISRGAGIRDLPRFADLPAGSLPSAVDRAAPPTAGFRLATVPITVGQYWRFVLDRGLDTRPAPFLHGFPADGGTGLRSTPAGTIIFDESLGDLPATGVTWRGALAYCEWLGHQTGMLGRLPSAAEWQYAAAGPSRTRWALGNDFDRKTYAPTATGPRPVGRSPANGFGLQDMTGNVFEWCADALTAPGAVGAAALGSRVIKGGAYTVRNPESFENATVFTADELSTVPYIGFRVLADPVETRVVGCGR